MKTLMLMIFCAALSMPAAFAQSNCTGPQVADWNGATVKDHLTMRADCTFDYDGLDGCHSRGTYAPLTSNIGRSKVTIDFSTGGDCIGAGEYSCWFDVQAQTLSYKCGGQGFSYTRQGPPSDIEN